MHRHAVISWGLGAVSSVFAQTAVSTDTYNAISRYHSFAAASYMDVCPTPPSGSKVLNFINVTNTDTQVSLFRDNAANELILAFRGSSSPIDLDTDLDFSPQDVNLKGVQCNGCQVHRGFQNAYNSASDQVVSAVQSAQSTYPGSTLTVTGHSLGGGLASLATASLRAQGLKFTTYTYGEPRNGNPAFSNYVDQMQPNYFRVTHANDGVPQIPPAMLGFQHHGTEYWLSQNSSNTAATTFRCNGTEPTTCNASTDFGVAPINGAHIQYIGLTASSLFNPGCGYAFK